MGAVLPLAHHRPAGPTRGTVPPLFGQNVPVRRVYRTSLSLRARVTLIFLATGLVAALSLSAVSFLTARSYLMTRRVDVVERQAFNNAQLLRTQLRSRRAEAFELISGLRTERGGFAVVHLTPENLFYSQELRYPQTAFPSELIEAVLGGTTARQRFTFEGEPYIGVGVSVGDIGAEYFEAFPLSSEERTLTVIGTALGIGILVVGGMSVLVGMWVGRRLMRPLERVAEAAVEIAAGGLDTRLEPENDPDLSRLVDSFNEMADAVQVRIEREARFASDVSHELRSPITALAAAVEVLDARRADLPDRTQQALDVVVSQIHRFDQMVLDLLELSRLDVGVADLHKEDTELRPLIGRIAARYGSSGVPVEILPPGDGIARVDRRRFERIMANLIENARIHGGGVTRIAIEAGPEGSTLVAVEDAGPGVATSERSRIFERFARGSAGRMRAGGTGLGLALVAEHVRAHGGAAWVEDSVSGGARFVIRIPGDTP